MTMNIDLDQLEATAKAATAGVWEVDRNTPFSREIMGIFQPDEKRYVVRVDDNFPDNPPGVSDADAAHIAAARPEVVLALIERLRTAEAALSTPPADDVREALNRPLTGGERLTPDEAMQHAYAIAVTRAPGRMTWGEALRHFATWMREHDARLTAEVRPHGTVTEAECAHEAWESIGVARRCADCRLLIPDAITCTTNHAIRSGGRRTVKITLRDIDNRDADGAPFEVTATVEEVVGYLDGPLRRDLTFDADAEVIDAAIEALRAGDIDRANAELRPLLVSVHQIRSEGEQR